MAETKTHTLDSFFLDQGQMSQMEHRRVWSFYKRFCLEMDQYYGEGHWILLCHAAFPVMLTPDLLYKIWMNFRIYPEKDDNETSAQAIPFVAVSDILLSGLCKEVGFEQYEMPANVRFALLEWLKQDRRFCEQAKEGENGAETEKVKDRVKELAEFLSAYLDESLKGNDARTLAYREAQEWAITSYLQPESAIRKMYEDFLDASLHQNKRKQLRLNRAIEQLQQQYSLRVQVNPDDNQAKKLENLVEYSRGTRSLLMGKHEEAITAFRKLPSLKDSSIKSATSTRTVQRTLSFPAAIAGESIRPQTDDDYDGEQIYALLVGIDEYAGEGIPPLDGCVNDVQAMGEYLREYHNEKDLRILKLLNKDATYQNVIENCRRHFKKARSEDVVLFYFSGHTSFIKTAPEFYSLFDDEMEASFVLHDSRTEEGDHKELSTLEFIVLLSEIGIDPKDPSIKHNPRIVVIIDTHYGEYLVKTPTQQNFEPTPNPLTIEGARPLASYLGGYYQGMLQKNGHFSFPQNTFLLLAGAKEKELAKETYLGGSPAGVFSYSLREILTAYQGKISYQDLLSKTRIKVQQRTYEQTPVLISYGDFDASLGFMDKEIEAQKEGKRIQVYFDKESDNWKLEGGLLQGFSADSIIHIRDEEANHTAFEIVDLGLQTSELRIQAAEKGYGAIEELNKDQIYETEAPTYILRNVYAEKRLRPSLQALKSVSLTNDLTEADWEITAEGGSWFITYLADGLQNSYTVHESDQEMKADSLFAEGRIEEQVNLGEKLEQVALWDWIMTLANPSSEISEDEIEFIVEKKFPDGSREQLNPQEGFIDLELSGDEQISLAFSVNNQLDQDIYMYLVALSNSFGMQLIGQEKVKSGASAILNEEVLYFFLDDEKEEAEDHLKCIYSTEAIDTSIFHQENLVYVPVSTR